MHRQKTKFSRRVNRVFTHRANGVAKALETRGIRATYELHDRVLSNRKSRQLFSEDQPQLDDMQRGIVAEVEARGLRGRVVRRPLPGGALAGDRGDGATASSPTTEADLAAGGDNVRVREGKEFVVRLHSYGVELGLDDPWFRAVASRRMLDIANAYLRMWSKLEYVDVWYSVPQPADAERVSSQRWHRDYNDKHLLKVFLYLVDVDEDDGARSSTCREASPAAQYADAWAWTPLGQNYPTEEELEARIPASAVHTLHSARRARSSSATPPASTAAASRRRSRASSRP